MLKKTIEKIKKRSLQKTQLESIYYQKKSVH